MLSDAQVRQFDRDGCLIGGAVLCDAEVDELNRELDRVIARGRVVVAHDVMRSLFEQRRGLSFHQPSRIVEAHALIQALALQQMMRGIHF